MHLVGFIIRIYHDARSSECQIHRAKVTADECRHLIQQNMLKKCSFFHYIYFTATQLNKIFTGWQPHQKPTPSPPSEPYQNCDDGEGVGLCDSDWFNTLDMAVSLRRHYWILKTDHGAKTFFFIFSGFLKTKIIHWIHHAFVFLSDSDKIWTDFV